MSDSDTPKQVFLGGACGLTTWRKDIAIPMFEAQGVTYHNPQMPLGAWKEDDQFDEMRRKDECLVQLFVINGDTRGVASVAEVAYLIGARKPVAIVLTDIQAGADVYGATIDKVEADDLNRGRIYVRAMAERHNVPVFTDIKEGTQYCIDQVKNLEGGLTLSQINEALAKVSYEGHTFNAEETVGGYHLWISALEPCTYTGVMEMQEGRRWFISTKCTPSDVVRTAFKAVTTWAEHEVRENFKYNQTRVFSPHLELNNLVARKTAVEEGVEVQAKAAKKGTLCAV